MVSPNQILTCTCKPRLCIADWTIARVLSATAGERPRTGDKERICAVRDGEGLRRAMVGVSSNSSTASAASDSSQLASKTNEKRTIKSQVNRTVKILKDTSNFQTEKSKIDFWILYLLASPQAIHIQIYYIDASVLLENNQWHIFHILTTVKISPTSFITFCIEYICPAQRLRAAVQKERGLREQDYREIWERFWNCIN